MARTTTSRHTLGQKTMNQQRQRETRTVDSLGAGEKKQEQSRAGQTGIESVLTTE